MDEERMLRLLKQQRSVKCIISNCTEFGKKRYNYLCKAHYQRKLCSTCGIFECSELHCRCCKNVVDDETKKYCQEHTCRSANCENLIKIGINPYYCPQHLCEYSDYWSEKVCVRGKTQRSKYCDKHRCSEKDCQNQCKPEEKSMAYIPYCINHKCNFPHNIISCKEKRVNDSDYCEGHKCIVKDCLEKKYFLHWKGKTYDYCAKHKCDYNCPNLCIEGKKNCILHTCIVDNCWENKHNETDYCSKHRCKFNNKCPHLRIEGTITCILHTCIYDGCDMESKYSDGGYCRDHLCKYPDKCNKFRLEGDYCESHTCVREDCLELSIYNNYCKKHICQFRERSSRKNNSSIHKYNKCKAGTVLNFKYCSDHKCSSDDCGELADNTMGLCKTHISDLLKMVKSNYEIRYKNAECIACMDSNIDTLLNCGHTICSECLPKLMKKECPMCRDKITKTQPIYLS